jgi:putative hydrolase of HD superfamily
LVKWSDLKICWGQRGLPYGEVVFSGDRALTGGVDSLPLLASDFPLSRHLAFLAELDKLKDIQRRSLVVDSRRRENSAEHSWHLAVMALVLMDTLRLPELDRFRVIKMLLLHDVVEIDAGDTFCYDVTANVSKAEREIAAATRIFSLLPLESATEFRALWDEFEAGATLESKFAQGLDRLHPVLQNLRTQGESWAAHGVTKEQVLKYNRKIGDTMPEIWSALVRELDRAEEQGFFLPRKS